MSAGLRRTVLLFAGLVALVAVAAFAKRSEVYLLTLTMVYLMATLGLNLTVGYAGQMSLGQAAFFGIGAAKANAIIAYRESNGPFMAVDELLEVKGIGKALLEKNRGRLEIK